MELAKSVDSASHRLDHPPVPLGFGRRPMMERSLSSQSEIPERKKADGPLQQAGKHARQRSFSTSSVDPPVPPLPPLPTLAPITPVEPASTRKISRDRLKHHKSNPSVSAATPSPPKPPIRRQETFEVASSGFSSINLDSRQQVGQASTWRESLADEALFRQLVQTLGKVEMKRQEKIFELCQTESAFVHNLQTVLKLFASPLKTPSAKWIAGIPTDVTRLFDWLDQIARLHLRIEKLLKDMLLVQHPVVINFAETFKPLISRFEIYLPYLLRFEAVSRHIAEMLRNPKSDFGEFVRIQSASPECQNLSLSSWLLQPMQRLLKYPLFFKQICDLTPANHEDHMTCLSLFHATDSTIRLMQEVKAQEEEFELISRLEKSLKGLPPNFTLANRKRRLLHQGPLQRVLLSDKDRYSLEAGKDARESRTTAANSDRTQAPAKHRGPLDQRPPSYVSDSGSSATASSVTAPSTRSSLSSAVAGNLDVAISESSFDNYGHPPLPSLPHDPKASPKLRQRPKEVPIYCFVFSDMAIFVTKHTERSGLLRKDNAADGNGPAAWKLLDSIGMAKLLGVTDWSGHLGYDFLLSVDLLSALGEPNKRMSSPRLLPGTHASTLFLTIGDRGRNIAPPRALQQSWEKWTNAFGESYASSRSALAQSTSISSLAAELYSPVKDTFHMQGNAHLQNNDEDDWWKRRLEEVRQDTADGRSRRPAIQQGAAVPEGSFPNRRRSSSSANAQWV